MTTVLLIDDDNDLRENTVDMLTLEGFDVVEATDGFEGLLKARDMFPDLILCDITMPELNGFEVLDELRQDSATAMIPFVFISSKADPEDIRTGITLGADDYVTKPFKRSDLINAVNARLERNADYQFQRLREFSQRIIAVQEAERSTLSSILKGKLIDSLSDVKLTLDLLNRLPPDAQVTTVQTATSLVNYALDEIEKLSQRLYPSTLDTIGLLPPILLLIDQFTNDADISVKFDHHHLTQITDTHHGITVYRVVQEALRNIRLHAEATHVDIRLWVEGEVVHLQVIDDGSGFNVEDAINDVSKTSIMTMQERIFVLGGELTILSSAEDGTRIIGSFPLTSTVSSAPMNRQQSATRFADIGMLELEPIEFEPKENIHRVALADANEITRWGLQSLINSSDNYTIAAQITDERGLFNLIDDLEIHILILSHTILSEQTAEDMIETLQDRFPSIRIVYISTENNYQHAETILSQGAYAYLLKSSSGNEVLSTLDRVAEGKRYMASDIADAIYNQSMQQQNNPQLDAYSTLTEREREIFHYVVTGMTSREIASELVISPRTVETHRLNMMRKLGIKGTSALIRFAMDHNLMS